MRCPVWLEQIISPEDLLGEALRSLEHCSGTLTLSKLAHDS